MNNFSKNTRPNATQPILVIEDEQDIRENVARWLQLFKYSTVMAKDGVDGFAMAILHLPQAIILDMKMPRKDGLETLIDLRGHELTAGIPVVMLSASLRDEQLALDAGANYFVQKPYDGRKLISTMKFAIEPAHPLPSHHFSLIPSVRVPS